MYTSVHYLKAEQLQIITIATPGNLKSLLFLVFIPFGFVGQSKDDLIGSWSLDKAYILKGRVFTVFEVEKHPYDTLHFSKDESFTIQCSQYSKKVHPPKEEHWTIMGKWKLHRKSLLLTDRHRTDKSENLTEVNYQILLEGDVLYINYGGRIDSNTVYIRYIRN